MRKEVLQAGQRVTKSLMRVQVLKSADKPSLSPCAECSDKAPKGKRRRDESADHSDAMLMLGRGFNAWSPSVVPILLFAPPDQNRKLHYRRPLPPRPDWPVCPTGRAVRRDG